MQNNHQKLVSLADTFTMREMDKHAIEECGINGLILMENAARSVADWIEENKLWNEIEVDMFDPKQDRVMICGSEDMTNELKNMFEKLGSEEGSTKVQGGFVIEKAFAEK